jgi:hypothetical protein
MSRFAKYFTTAEIASILGVEAHLVYRVVERKLIQPALRAGLQQFNRAGLLKFAVYFAMQRSLGVTSALPALAVRGMADEAAGSLADEVIERGAEALDVSIETAPGRKVSFRIPCPINRDELKKVPA